MTTRRFVAMMPPMAKVMLRTRDLNSGNPDTEEFEGVDKAIAWLTRRPAMVEVLGVVFEGITKDENERMKAAMRPLDVEEKAKVDALDAAERKVREDRAAARKLEAEAEVARAREAAKTADPARPMEVAYRYDSDALKKTDGMDEREITDAVREAAKAWVAERNEWVEGRGQVVGEAKITIYPGEVPKGQDRVVTGSFVPVTAAAKA